MKKSKNEVADAMGVDISPRFSLTTKELPDIKDWSVGKEYTITLKVKQVSMEEGGWDGKQPMSASFKVISASSDDGDGADSEDSSEQD